MPLEHLTRSESLVARGAVAAAAVLGAVSWIYRVAPKKASDPCPSEVDLAVRTEDAVPVCVSCLFPQEERSWFCPNCAYPAGEYVTLMPFLQNFAIGELFRRGVVGPPENGIGRKAFFFVASIGEYNVFAPLYWFWMIRKAKGKPICGAPRRDPIISDNA